MGERGIIMSGESVRAILAGTKTQTRRPVRFPVWGAGCFDDPLKLEIETDEHGRSPEVICNDTGCLAALPLRWQVGDRLWVREAWQLHARASDLCTVVYRASVDGGWTAAHEQFRDYLAAGLQPKPFQAGWRSPIHMPRWASRLTLAVTDVRVQRLQDISEEDAVAEGAEDGSDHACLCANIEGSGYPNDLVRGSAAVTLYRDLWNSLHGRGAWARNPWVAAISFAVEPRGGDHGT